MAALLVAYILPVCALLAPCHPGAALRDLCNESLLRDTSIRGRTGGTRVDSATSLSEGHDATGFRHRAIYTSGCDTRACRGHGTGRCVCIDRRIGSPRRASTNRRTGRADTAPAARLHHPNAPARRAAG